MEPIIEFQNFSFKYRSQKEPTLKDINLAIYPGEKVLIVGPSGSGKSTLAHCINGLVPFSYAGDITGTYRIKGEDPAKLGIFGLSKSVGTVLQDTDGQFIGLTVAEDIAFALENDRVEYHEMRRRVDKAADAVDVKDLLDHAPGALSGGQGGQSRRDLKVRSNQWRRRACRACMAWRRSRWLSASRAITPTVSKPTSTMMTRSRRC